MATGDMRNNLRKLQKQVSLIRYPDELDYEGLTKGNVSSYLPLLYFAFFDFNPRVVENISKMEYNLSGKRDAAFMNVVFKIMRERGSKSSLNLKVAQFMSKGFAERKIILTTDILIFVRTCPELGGGKPRVRSQSGAAMTALLSNCGKGVEAAEVSEIKSDITLASNRTLCTKHPTNIVAPKMQSTSRSTLRNVSLSQVTNFLCSTIGAATDELHSVEEDEPPSHAFSKSDDLENVGHHDTTHENIGELKNLVQVMQQKQDLLESENTKLKSDLETMQTENMKVKKEIEALLSKQPHMDITNVIARLDVIESRLLVIENTAKMSSYELQSPVCGHNLCSEMNKLHLQENNSFVDVTQVTSDGNDKSLLDVTNESPLRSRNQRMKLINLVQGTRTLLGMGDVSDFQDTENIDRTECDNKSTE